VHSIQRDFFLFAGTGTPSLQETINLTKSAFDLGYQAVVVLPPYYYKRSSDDGLFSWYSTLIKKAVPAQAALFVYHIPALTGVGISLKLLHRLKSTFPDQLVGIKDSSGDPTYAKMLVNEFRSDLSVLTGNEHLLMEMLNNGGSGCITALANTHSPTIRQIWDKFHHSENTSPTQEYMSQVRTATEKHGPFPPLIKALLPLLHNLPAWSVRPPLLPISKEQADLVLHEIQSIKYEA
jgi:4-hydroxy-tetrahydrodipicolinate synthase